MSNNKLRMNAYYYGFDDTGIDAIDRILSAVACAGKTFHHTECWNDEAKPYDGHFGRTPIEWIQNAADDAAKTLASGPMMPETPSEAVIVAAFTYAGIPDDANDDKYRADFKGLWSAIRSALMQGQGRG